jgi:hypothetical protein
MCKCEMRLVVWSVGVLAIVLFAQMWPPHPHYAAPATGVFILMALYSIRHFRQSHGFLGVCVSRAIVGSMAVLLLSPVLECMRDPYVVNPIFVNANFREPGESFAVNFFMTKPPYQVERQRLEAELEARPGKHLVIVHHPYHDVPSVDWVYNRADLASSKVIWARDMGYLKNRELVNYFPDRQVWFVDRAQAKLIPYDQATLPWKLAFDSPPFGPASDQGILADAEKTPAATPKRQIAVNSTKDQTPH